MRNLWFPTGATVLMEVSGTTASIPLTAPATCPVCAHPMPIGAAVCRSCVPVVVR